MTGPALSIVIASFNLGPVPAECLDAVLAQPSADLSEITVADSSTDGTAELTRERFPQVVLLHFDDRRSVPRLRGAGIAVARGQLIGLLDPCSIVQGDWAGQVMRTHGQRPEPAIGGSVALGANETASLAR